MQPGVSNKSQLLESLRDYLNNKKRLQPIIGLGSIIECVKVGPQNRESFYVCEVCVCQLNKADMRNHILGSLHRFNYIKTWHPYLLSEWQENSDLSKLAWPLMEKAKVLERKEGPGDVQLLEIEDAVYQRMATHREKDAIALVNSLKKGQIEPETTSLHYPVQSQRMVLLAQSQQGMSKKSLKADKKSYKTAQSEQKALPVMQAKPPVKPEVWVENVSTSQLNDTQTSPESVSEKSRNFLDDYTGTKPLIGLSCVVEYRSEDGCSYCFLCHCCRVKSDKKDVTDHLTSSSHLSNYLMESYPEQVVGMSADIRDDQQLLCSLAKKVEQKDGRGELKVVNAPESFCMQLTGKSYHWCINMLSSGWTHTNIQKKRTGVKGSAVSKTSDRDVPEKYHSVLPKRAKRQKTKTKNGKVPNTVFSVSLPLTKGSILLERSSFSTDSLPVCFSSPPSDEDLGLSPGSQITGSEFYDCGSESFEVDHGESPTMCKTSQLQQDHYGGDPNAGQYIPEIPLTDTLLQEGYANNDAYVLQSEDVTGTKDDEMYGEGAYNRQHGSQESSCQKFFEESRNENRQTHNEGRFPAVSHTMTWPPYRSSYRQDEGGAEQWHSSTSQSQAGERVEGFAGENHKGSSFDALRHYYQQHQYATVNTGLHYNTAPVTGSVGHHYPPGEPVAYSNAAQTNRQDCLAYNGSIPSQPGGQYPDGTPRSSQTYTEFATEYFQTAAQSYGSQSAAYQAYQAAQVDQGWTSNHSTGTWTNPDPHYAYPASICGGAGVQCYHPTWPSSVLRDPLRS